MDRWEFFRDAEGLWRWQRSSKDGQVVTSPWSYPSRRQAIDSAEAHGFTPEAEIDAADTFVALKSLGKKD